MKMFDPLIRICFFMIQCIAQLNSLNAIDVFIVSLEHGVSHA